MRIKRINFKFLVFLLEFLLLSLGPFASFSLADVGKFLGDHRYDEAISELEEQLKGKDFSDHSDLLFDLGKAYHKKGLIYTSFYEVGIKLERDYYELLKKDKIKSCLPFYLGVCYFEMAQYDKAIDEFKDLKKVENLSKTYQLLSSVWIEASRSQLGQKGAMAKLEKIKNKNKNNPVVVSEVAYFLSSVLGKDKEALQLIQGIKPPIDLFQNRFYRNLAYIYMKNQMSEKVKEMHELMKLEEEEFVAEIDTTLIVKFYDVTALKILALVNCYLSDQAFSHVMEARTTHKRWQTVLYFRGLNAFYLGDYHKAAELLGQSEHPVAGVYLGSAYYRLGRDSKAIAIWSEVEKSENEWALRELGRQQASLVGNPTKGIQLCEYALKLTEERSPRSKRRYCRYLGWAFLQNGEPNEAVEAFEEGYDHSRANDLNYYEPEFLAERAFCLYKKSDLNWSEAIEIYFVLLERYPAARQIHYALQGIELAVGRRTKGSTKY